jgi:hypothetical protein
MAGAKNEEGKTAVSEPHEYIQPRPAGTGQRILSIRFRNFGVRLNVHNNLPNKKL